MTEQERQEIENLPSAGKCEEDDFPIIGDIQTLDQYLKWYWIWENRRFFASAPNYKCKESIVEILKSEGNISDKQVLSDLIDKEELFWTNYVVPQIPPAPNGCDCDTQQINQMYEVDNRDKTADLSALHGLLDKRQELSDQIEQMEQEKTAIEQQVKLQMQDAAYGTAPGYKVSWVSSESKRVDSQRLRKEQPDIFNQYSKNVSSRRFTIVHAA